MVHLVMDYCTTETLNIYIVSGYLKQNQVLYKTYNGQTIIYKCVMNLMNYKLNKSTKKFHRVKNYLNISYEIPYVIIV